MTINNAIKTELNKRMFTKVFNLNMGSIFFNVSDIKLLKVTLHKFYRKIQNNLITTSWKYQ